MLSICVEWVHIWDSSLILFYDHFAFYIGFLISCGVAVQSYHVLEKYLADYTSHCEMCLRDVS